MFPLQLSRTICAVGRKCSTFTGVIRGGEARTTEWLTRYSIQCRAFSDAADKAKKATDAAKVATAEPTKQSAFTLKRVIAGVTVGITASALGSMVGLGGGFIIIPLLTHIGGLSQHEAASCSSASIFVTALSGTGTYVSQGLIDLPSAAVITITSMIMARLGSKWSNNFESKKLKLYYGWLCLLVAPLIPLKNYIMQKRKEKEAQEKVQIVEDLEEENRKIGYRDCMSKEAWDNSIARTNSPLLLALGLVGGTMSGFFGVGGGIIMSPSLCLFTKMPQKSIAGTSLAAMIIPTAISTVMSYKAGKLIFSLASPICVGSLAGGYIGSRIAGKMPAKKIQWVLVSLLILSGLKSVL